MTKKRFTDDGIEEIENQSFTDNLTEKTYWIDNGLDEIVELLNKLHEENEHLKLLLQDMGLLRSDKEVMDIRNEIADKLIKPVCNENGFEVDVDCTNGFTIIPKNKELEE